MEKRLQVFGSRQYFQCLISPQAVMSQVNDCKSDTSVCPKGQMQLKNEQTNK